MRELPGQTEPPTAGVHHELGRVDARWSRAAHTRARAATKEVAVVEPPLWTAMGVCQLVDHIELTHHRHLWNELPRLDTLAARVIGIHGDHHPELIAIREDLGAVLVPHLLDEERVLFPAVIRLVDQEARWST